jgi:AcrR family transcriptional regulator
MSPRRAEQTDQEILTRAVHLVRRHGPKVTLTTLASEIGLSAARLIQRFGPRARFLATVEDWADRRMLDAVGRNLDLSTDPIAALVNRLAQVAERNAKRLHLLSNSYLYDPGHAGTPAGIREAKRRETLFIRTFENVLDRAAELGQLAAGTDRSTLARAISVMWTGTYTVWAYAPVGRVGALVIQDLSFLLAPYRTGRSIRRSSTRGRARKGRP